MATTKEQIIRAIQGNAGNEAAAFAGQYARSTPEEKEALLASLDFERWLEQCCQECLNDRGMLR